MPAYSPHVHGSSQWTQYFLKQIATDGKDGKKKIPSDSSHPIGGGVGYGDHNISLSRVGKLKKSGNGNDKKEMIKIEMTSPAEASVEQAKDKLKNINEGLSESYSISRQRVKRKASSSKKKVSRGNKAKPRRKGRGVKQANDKKKHSDRFSKVRKRVTKKK